MSQQQHTQECTILQRLGAGVWIVNAEGRASFVNSAAASILGCQPEEIIGRELAEFVFPEDIPRVRQDLLERKEGRSASWVARFRSKDGTPRWVRVTASPMHQPAGDYTGAIGILLDVTDTHAAAEKSRSVAELLGLTLSSLPIILFEQDVDLRYVWVRGSGLPLPSEQILGRTDEELFAPDVAQRLRQVKQRVMETGVTEHMTLPLATRERLLFFEASIAPCRNGHGRTMGIAGALLDVTGTFDARHRAEESDARFRLVLSLSTLSAFTQDSELRYSWIYNPPAHYDEREILGRTDADIFPADQAAALTALKRAVLESGAGRKTEITLGHGKTVGTYELTIEPQRDLRGNIVGILGLAIDITERVRAESRMEETIRTLEAVIQHSSEAVGLVDPSGIIRCVSGPTAEALGYSREELVGMECVALLEPADMLRARFELADLRQDPSGTILTSLRLRRRLGPAAWFPLRVLTVSIGESHAFLVTLDRNALTAGE